MRPPQSPPEPHASPYGDRPRTGRIRGRNCEGRAVCLLCIAILSCRLFAAGRKARDEHAKTTMAGLGASEAPGFNRSPELLAWRYRA